MLLAVVTFVTLKWAYSTRFGLVLNAIRDNEDKAEAMGIHTMRYKIIGWMVSAFFVGIAGGLMGHINGYIEPTEIAFAGPTFGVFMVLMAILGGKGTLWGPLVGATIFHLFKEGFWTYFLGWQYVALGVLIIVIVVYFPEGVMGWLREKYPERFGEVVDEADSKSTGGIKVMAILDISNVSKSFGGVKANVDISMSVEQGSIVGLIGPNGSGKTTLFNSIVGTYPIDDGSIKFDGTEVSELPVPVVAKLGLLRTFQQTRIYGKLNCIQNMLISHKPENDGILSVFQKIPSDLTDKAETLLKFVGLHQKRKLRAGDLSFGQQKLLELAMALMNEPKMLLLDEPTAGINPTLINGIIDRLISVNKDYGITLLVIEHNMKVIMNLAQRVFCLAHGQMLANGTPDEIKNDKRVLDAYLGAQ